MLRKFKIAWVLCCVGIFIGFSYLSGQNRLQDIDEQRQGDAEERKHKAEENIKHKELKIQFEKLWQKFGN